MILFVTTSLFHRSDCFDEDSRIRRCVQEFKLKIDELNNAKLHEIQQHLNAAVENFIAGNINIGTFCARETGRYLYHRVGSIGLLKPFGRPGINYLEF